MRIEVSPASPLPLLLNDFRALARRRDELAAMCELADHGWINEEGLDDDCRALESAVSMAGMRLRKQVAYLENYLAERKQLPEAQSGVEPC
jgi:hypothetical protein